MKKTISILVVLALMLGLAPASLGEAAAKYIPAPYAIDEAKAGPTEYLAPVFYENENGPTIGVTLVGVIEVDGLYFKDSDNDQELDVFEDWRLDTATRMADLLPKLSMEQRAGLIGNQMMCSPVSTKIADVLDGDGNVILSQLINLTEGDVWSAENNTQNSIGTILGAYSRAGVMRSNPDAETGALFNNVNNMVSEYASVALNLPVIPFLTLSNPISNGQPSNNGFAAAAMADGNYDLIEKYSDLDRQIWFAKGIDAMYGPQIDLITDPRWNRNNGAYTEDPEVMAGIAVALVKGYQTGTDGAQSGDVGVIMKHFPGDGAAENGFESHNFVGEWRIYATEGSLEKYQLVPFQAAIDAGMAGVMPGYSRQATDARTAPQTYRGVEISPELVGNAYNKTILQTLLKDAMGFNGLVNTDSGIISGQYFGIDAETTLAQRYAMIINAGSDNGANGMDYVHILEAINTGLVEPEALDRATTNRLAFVMNQGEFENPYRDPETSKATIDGLADELAAVIGELNDRSVVLMKNHENALPVKDTARKVYVGYFHSGATGGGWGAAPVDPADLEKAWKALFEEAGFTLTDKAEEADVAFLSINPGGVNNAGKYMNVISLVDGLVVPERSGPASQAFTGEETEVTTLIDVDKIPAIADAVHANGGIVVASINLSSPWILTNLEPYCDALLGHFSTANNIQLSVLTGGINPTGKLPVTLVSCEEVIAVNEVEIDGVVYEICVSPNDVPGYDKDQYIDAEVLAQSPSGSYAYQDADGNIYKAWHGLSY